jgi:hypothetical protein
MSLATATPGWRAVYVRGDIIVTRELAAWALIEAPRGTNRRVDHEMIGMVLEDDYPVFADRAGETGEQFCGYIAPGEDLERLRSRAGKQGAMKTSDRTRPPFFASTWFG